jgi:2',3'-cyclic-nucleotide 2'-phosphodiesterase (5'-nucleotidase family)
MVDQFKNLKSDEKADALIALSHLGHTASDDEIGDFQLAQQFPFFDMILGGHSHAIVDTSFNNIPIYQAGAYLHFMGKIELEIKDKNIVSSNFSLINLDQYTQYDNGLQALIEGYNNEPELYEEIGYSEAFHSKASTGCFYTHALRAYMGADVSFQNTGGIRSRLDDGTL